MVRNVLLFKGELKSRLIDSQEVTLTMNNCRTVISATQVNVGEVLSAIFPPSHNAREAYPSTFWIIYKLLLLASVNKGSAKNIDFFYLGFLSRKQGKGKGNLFNSSLPLPPASHLDISPAIIADSSLHLLLPWFCLDLITKSVFLSFKWVMHLMEGNLECLNCFVVVAE